MGANNVPHMRLTVHSDVLERREKANVVACVFCTAILGVVAMTDADSDEDFFSEEALTCLRETDEVMRRVTD